MAVFKYQKIVDDMVKQIEQGQLSGRLLSVRALAKHRNISASTVVQAYCELERLGWIISRPKQGFYVNAAKQHFTPDYGKQINLCDATISLAQAVQFSFNDPHIVPLSCTAPSTVLNNEALLNRLHKKALTQRPFQLIMDDPVEGLPALRAQLANHLSHQQGLINANEILITNGRKDSLMIALNATKALTHTIAVESPCSFYFQAMLSQLNANVVEVPMQSLFADELALLDKAHQQTQFNTYLVNPSFADPTGRLLSVSDKLALLRWAAVHQVTLIEYDRSELFFGDEKPPTLTNLITQLSPHEPQPSVITIGDFYDTVSPTFSLGYLIAKGESIRIPACTTDKLTSTTTDDDKNDADKNDAVIGKKTSLLAQCLFSKQVIAEEANIVLQYMLSELLYSGQYHRLLNQLRTTMKQQMLTFIEALDARTAHLNKHHTTGQLSPVYISHPTGGPCLWCKLPSPYTSAELWQRLIEKGIAIAPGSMFAFSHNYDSFFRITFALPWNSELKQALTQLSDEIAQLIAPQQSFV